MRYVRRELELGIEAAGELAKSPFAGALFEGFVASEIVKAQINRGRRAELYYFRDAQGLEVDFLLPGRGGSIRLVECKASRTATPGMARRMQRLAHALEQQRPRGVKVELSLVCQGSASSAEARTVAPGVRVLAWREFASGL